MSGLMARCQVTLASGVLRFATLPSWHARSASRHLNCHHTLPPGRYLSTAVKEKRSRPLDLAELDEKWRRRWEKVKATPQDSSAPAKRKSMYVLPMWPYPSGNLHLGHLRVYTIADVVARYHKLKGQDVVLPMGWDSFGLPAENAALKHGVSPATWTRENIARMKEQLQLMNGSWDWQREISTCEPDYYKQTQQIFLKLYAQNLAYQEEAEVNYDPIDKTVLANEQVDANGISWRSGAVVEKRRLRQWFLRISHFREELLRDLDTLRKDEAWPEKVLTMQKNWLGKSTGANIRFSVLSKTRQDDQSIEVFTTRPDTLLGVQYLALSSSHPIVQELAQSDQDLQNFLVTLPTLPAGSKAGYLLPEIHAQNPLSHRSGVPNETSQAIPVYVASYVLADYGQGAVMGVPAHDTRDFEFWKQHRPGEAVRTVISSSGQLPPETSVETPFVEQGILTASSGEFAGQTSQQAMESIVKILSVSKSAEPIEKWRLRDWLISRQRYWGTPIPIIHCDSCGGVPVPVDQLPVTLPNVDYHWTNGKPGNPLETCDDWVNSTCPKCGGPAKRDTDTMDTFVDSSWYFMRFADPHNAKEPASALAVEQMLPVDIYIGGVEHAILHLLYARFMYKFLMSSVYPEIPMDLDQVQEPFTRLITQGLVHGKTYNEVKSGQFVSAAELDLSHPGSLKVQATGEAVAVTYQKMSKSKGNGVDPTECIAQHGADAVRAHVLFQAPVADLLLWDDDKIAGIVRWLGRVYTLATQLAGTQSRSSALDALMKGAHDGQHTIPESDRALWLAVQSTIVSVTRSYEDIYSLNTVVSDLMSLTNAIIEMKDKAQGETRLASLSVLLRLMAPITPAFSSECCQIIAEFPDSLLFDQGGVNVFPKAEADLSHLQPTRKSCVVQVNGRVRTTVDIPEPPEGLGAEKIQSWIIAEVQAAVKQIGKLSTEINLGSARKVIVVKGGKLVNFVM